MRSARILAAAAVTAGVLVAPMSAARSVAPSGADVIRVWTGLAAQAVAQAGTGDAGAARTYAMVDAAMYDAINALLPAVQRHTPAIVAPDATAATGDPVLAAATAAHDVLCALYPAQGAVFESELRAETGAGDPASLPCTGNDAGTPWGHFVGSRVVAARAFDGSSGSQIQPGSNAIGQFDKDWNTQPQHLAPFVIADPSRYVDAGPPPLTSVQYALAFNEVKRLGDSRRADPDADATFAFWSLGTGTEQPPGAWLHIASIVSAARTLSLPDTARLFALTSMAMCDTVAPTYTTKARYHAWRPVAAIAHAAEDRNLLTAPAPYVWAARGGSPGSPEHWSGHSSFSAAAATILAAFFGTDRISFTTTTGSAKGASRSFSSFSAAAAQAGRSRVLGGLHFPFSNTAGLKAGRDIANEVLARTR